MIRTFLTTTALATLMATGAFAQDAPATPETPASEAPAGEAPAEGAPSDAPADAESTMETEPADDADAAAGADAEVVEDVEVITEGDGQATTGSLAEGYAVVDSDNLASRIIGAAVYSSNEADAEHIGDVNDLVVNESGDVAAVVIGVGGFLGIGEKNVAVDYTELEWVIADDNTERFVLNATRESLEAAPAFEWRDDQPAADAGAAPVADPNAVPPAAGDPAAPAAGDPAAPAAGDPAAPAAGDPAAPAADPMAPDAAVGVDTQAMQEVDPANLTAEQLQGTDVYGPGDEHIGTIGDLVLGENDAIDAVIIDFGGFLGIGVKQVAVAYEGLQFMADQNDNLILVLNLTREQMEQAPEYNPETYEAERDTQRVVVQ